jgi:uncharacterized protein YihD (DUF1040 family)
MPKYNYDELIQLQDPEMHTDYVKTLVAIANELAESNRLKRLEIKLKIHELNMTSLDNDSSEPTILDDNEADTYYAQLEDRA